MFTKAYFIKGCDQQQIITVKVISYKTSNFSLCENDFVQRTQKDIFCRAHRLILACKKGLNLVYLFLHF